MAMLYNLTMCFLLSCLLSYLVLSSLLSCLMSCPDCRSICCPVLPVVQFGQLFRPLCSPIMSALKYDFLSAVCQLSFPVYSPVQSAALFCLQSWSNLQPSTDLSAQFLLHESLSLSTVLNLVPFLGRLSPNSPSILA